MLCNSWFSLIGGGTAGDYLLQRDASSDNIAVQNFITYDMLAISKQGSEGLACVQSRFPAATTRSLPDWSLRCSGFGRKTRAPSTMPGCRSPRWRNNSLTSRRTCSRRNWPTRLPFRNHTLDLS